MDEMVKVTEEFVADVNELMVLIMRQCTIKNIANMSKDEIEIAQKAIKLVNTSNELLTNYQKAFREMNSKIDIITKLLVEKKENEGQK